MGKQLFPGMYDQDAGSKLPADLLGKGRRYDLHVAGYGNGGYIATYQRPVDGRWFHYTIKFDMGRVTTHVQRLDDDDYWRPIHAWRIDRDGTGAAVPAADWWML